MPKARGCERPGEKGDPTGAEATGDPPWGLGGPCSLGMEFRAGAQQGFSARIRRNALEWRETVWEQLAPKLQLCWSGGSHAGLGRGGT